MRGSQVQFFTVVVKGVNVEEWHAGCKNWFVKLAVEGIELGEHGVNPPYAQDESTEPHHNIYDCSAVTTYQHAK